MSRHPHEDLITPYRERVELFLDNNLPDADVVPGRLHSAIRYSTLNAGKRLRASLVYITGEAFGAATPALDPAAAAVELIHAYSLVHDDMPCMDDDDLRRGKPSCHIKYDEATAMLVGDALQSRAFEVLASEQHPGNLAVVHILAKAAGSMGMAGGQSLDLDATGKALSLEELKHIHRMKTGALIEAAVMMGACIANIDDPNTMELLSVYSRSLGLGFQIQDDILDVTSDTEVLGKQVGADAGLDKSTYPGILGLPGAKKAAANTCEEALDALQALPVDTEKLRLVAEYAINRIY